MIPAESIRYVSMRPLEHFRGEGWRAHPSLRFAIPLTADKLTQARMLDHISGSKGTLLVTLREDAADRFGRLDCGNLEKYCCAEAEYDVVITLDNCPIYPGGALIAPVPEVNRG